MCHLLIATTEIATRKNINKSILHRSMHNKVAGDKTAVITSTIIILLACGKIKQMLIKNNKIKLIPMYVV
jgi:hypothetical protein